MSNLTHLFKVGQKVTYRNNDFDVVKRDIPCVVKETYPDHIIITDVEVLYCMHQSFMDIECFRYIPTVK